MWQKIAKVVAVLSAVSAVITIVVYLTGAPYLKDLLSPQSTKVAPPPSNGAPHVDRGTPIAKPSPQPRPVPPDPHAIERDYWQTVDLNNIASLQRYLDRYPDGEFANIDRQRIAALQEQSPATAQYTGASTPYSDSQHGFSLSLPEGWILQESADVENVHRTSFQSPRFATERVTCFVITGKLPNFAKSQDELDASVQRGGLEVSLKDNDILHYDPQAVVDDHPIVRVGDLYAQSVHVTFVAEGLRLRMKRIITVVAPGNVFMVSCMAPATMYDKNEPEFDVILNSFRVAGHP